MSRSNRTPRHPDNFRSFRDDPPRINRGPGPLPLNPAMMEEQIEFQHRDMQRIIFENRNRIDDNTILQREVEAVKDEIHRLGQVIPKVRADTDLQGRELIDIKLKIEAELRAAEPLRADVMKLRGEAQKLNAARQDLSGQIKSLKKDITQLQSENKQVITMKGNIDAMRKELSENRRFLDYEKKAKEEQLEQKEAMEKNLVSMAREIEKLRSEQMNSKRRAQGQGLGGGGYGNPDMRLSGGAFGESYSGAWGPYEKRPRR